MPNHVKNRLTIIGDEKSVESIRCFLEGEPFENGEKRLVDFNKIVQCPEIIKQVGNIHIGIEHKIKQKYNITRDLYKEVVLRQDDLPAFEKACKAYEETGFIYWYDWNIENWGTKWNAYDFDYETPKNILVWRTAWSDVRGLIKKLSLKFANIEFLYDWADEDIGHNCGRTIIKNGEAFVNDLEQGSRQAYEMSFDLMPEYREHYRIVDGEYEQIDDE
jgi:hypothetical protein